MSNNDPIVLDRRRILAAALASGGTVALAGCTPSGDGKGVGEADVWAGYDQRDRVIPGYGVLVSR